MYLILAAANSLKAFALSPARLTRRSERTFTPRIRSASPQPHKTQSWAVATFQIHQLPAAVGATAVAAHRADVLPSLRGACLYINPRPNFAESAPPTTTKTNSLLSAANSYRQ